MTYFEIIFVGWACLGDVGFLGLKLRPVPDAMRPLAAAVGVVGADPLCRMVPEIERASSRQAMENRVRDLGQVAAPRLRWCQKFKCHDRKIEWGKSLIVDGKEIK